MRAKLNVPENKVGSASGIYKMASSLGAAFGIAISAAIFYGLSKTIATPPMANIFMGRTDNIDVRFAAATALISNVFMVVVAIIVIQLTIPKSKGKKRYKLEVTTTAQACRVRKIDETP